MCEEFNCSTLSVMKIKQSISGGKKESKHSYYSKKDAKKAIRESIPNTKGSTCYPSTTKEL